MKRIFVNNLDIEILEGVSKSQACRIMKRLKRELKREMKQKVSVFEYMEFRGIKDEKVVKKVLDNIQ
jgi:hypothetical protein